MLLSTLMFIILGSIGNILTVILLYQFTRRANISNHEHALILSIGLGLTWFVAPMAAFSVSGKNSDFVLLLLANSVFVALLLYALDRLFLRVIKQTVFGARLSGALDRFYSRINQKEDPGSSDNDPS